MRMRHRTGRLLILLSLIPAAATADPRTYATPPLDFALHLGRYETRLDDGLGRVEATVKRIGISAYGNADPTLQAGLLLGYATLSDDQALTAGREPDGFYAGPALRSEFYAGHVLRAGVTGSYIYQRVREEDAGVSQVVEWQQWQLALDTRWRLGARVGLLLGGHYGGISAEQRLSGTVNQTRSLDHDPVFGGRAGLEFDFDGDGRIGIAAERGELDGLDIYFERQF